MKRSTRIVFLTIEALLYAAFLLMDLLTDADTRWLKFAAILLVALASLLSDNRLFTTALCLTAAADVFLLVLDRCYEVGLLLFVTVQLLYSFHLKSKRFLAVQIALTLISVMIGGITLRIEGLAAGYIAVFTVNLLHAGFLLARQKSKHLLLFFTGLVLFFCCDLCVGYFNLGTGPFYSFARIAMWGFYLPGQILILLYSLDNQGDFQ